MKLLLHSNGPTHTDLPRSSTGILRAPSSPLRTGGVVKCLALLILAAAPLACEADPAAPGATPEPTAETTTAAPPGSTPEATGAGSSRLHNLVSDPRAGVSDVQALLAEGVDVNARDSRGETALHRAARLGNAPVVAALLDGGADIQAANARGETPLHRAVMSDQPAIVELLLDRGADIDATDAAAEPPLGYASPEMARLLLDRGADPNAGENSPLVEAVRDGDAARVELFLDHGGDINVRSHGRTALHAAVSTIYSAPDGLAMIELLLDRGADIDALDRDGVTPLLFAVFTGHAGSVELLLDRGADLFAADTSWGVDILGSALNSTPEVMQVLIQRGVLAAYDPAVASDLCYSATVFSGPPAVLLREHCDATGVAARSRRAQEAMDGSDLLPEHPWAADLEPRSDEYFAVQDLRELASSHPRAFEIIRQFTLLADGITRDERDAIDILRQLIERFPAGDPALLDALSQTWWRLREDVTYSEVVAFLALALEDWSQQVFLEVLRNRPRVLSPPEPTPTPTPRPTLGPLVPVADLSWTKDGLTALEQAALADLETFEQRFPEMAEFVLSYTWVADGITEDEQLALRHLLYITQGGRPPLISPLRDDDYRWIVDTMRHHYYLMDGISPADLQFLQDVTRYPEQAVMVAVFLTEEPREGEVATPPTPTPAAKPTATPTPAVAGNLGDLPWVRDGLTDIEREALGYAEAILRRLQPLSDTSALLEEVLATPWLVDGIDEGERWLLCLAAAQPDPVTAFAFLTTTAPSPDLPACP